MYSLKIKNLTKSFHAGLFSEPKKVLHNISFDVPRETITGFLGINGAGKSTTIKCILNLIVPDSGEIYFFDQKQPSALNKLRIGYLPEKPNLYDYLTGEEFLRFCLELAEVQKNEISKRVDEYLDLVDLVHARKYKLREYSKGMYQRIGLAQALCRNSDLIILDEPMSDLDPEGRHLVKSILREIQISKKTSIFMSTHLLQDVEDLCSDIVILDKGQMMYSGATRSFIDRIHPTYEITYIENNVFRKIVVDKDVLQTQIDSLRSHQKSIVEVQSKGNLETAFHQFIGEKK